MLIADCATPSVGVGNGTTGISVGSKLFGHYRIFACIGSVRNQLRNKRHPQRGHAADEHGRKCDGGQEFHSFLHMITPIKKHTSASVCAYRSCTRWRFLSQLSSSLMMTFSICLAV